jgi:hypothetical protein
VCGINNPRHTCDEYMGLLAKSSMTVAQRFLCGQATMGKFLRREVLVAFYGGADHSRGRRKKGKGGGVRRCGVICGGGGGPSGGGWHG